MSKKNVPVKKKVVASKAKAKKKAIKSTVSRTKVTSTAALQPLLFKRINFIYMGVGVLLMAIGFALMSGGGMDDPNVWDESVIYGFRRITLAPILIVGGLVLQVFAIFAKSN